MIIFYQKYRKNTHYELLHSKFQNSKIKISQGILFSLIIYRHCGKKIFIQPHTISLPTGFLIIRMDGIRTPTDQVGTICFGIWKCGESGEGQGQPPGKRLMNATQKDSAVFSNFYRIFSRLRQDTKQKSLQEPLSSRYFSSRCPVLTYKQFFLSC